MEFRIKPNSSNKFQLRFNLKMPAGVRSCRHFCSLPFFKLYLYTMPKLLLVTLSFFVVLTLKAQLPNASFEQTDSLGKIAYWKSPQGKLTQLTSAQFGVIPFTPYEGNFFVLLEPDTQTSTIKKGIMEQTFAFADTPGSVEFRYFYIPESITQHGQMELLMSKWNGTSRDTVLYIKDAIVAVADSNNIRIQWNTWSATLQHKYRNGILPDSTHIQFQNDDRTSPGKTVRLYLDALNFGKWAVGINELTTNYFLVYPNPANKYISIVGIFNGDMNYELISLDGKHYPLAEGNTADSSASFDNSITLNTRDIPSGLYLLRINSTKTSITKRILINHEL